MKNYFWIALLFVLTTSIAAQKPQGVPPNANLKIGRIYGKLRDALTKQPVAYASVTLMRTMGGRDSLISGALSEDNGDFNITGLPMGVFKVKVSFVGYKDFEKNIKIAPPEVEQDLGDLALAVDAKVLNALEVKAEKVSNQMNLEKRVFNVDKNLTSAGGTAEDVLKNVPSVSVDVDGNVALRNRGTTIYVDGKPTVMAITQIPADQIESVEVISNPSAKYDASTTGGIVNLVLKKNRKPGYNGMVAIGVGQNSRYNGMANLNMHEGRLNMTAFYNINSTKNPSQGYTYRTVKNTEGVAKNYFDQTTNMVVDNYFQMGRLALDYSVNNRNTFTVAGTIADGQFNINLAQDFTYGNANHAIDSSGSRITTPENYFRNYGVETGWKKTFPKKGEVLTASINYNQGNVANTAAWTTMNYDIAQKLKPNQPEKVSIAGGNQNQQALFQLDYVNPINDSTKVEMGLRSMNNWRDQTYFYNDYSYFKADYIQNNNFSQDAKIEDRVNAAYVTYTSRWAHQISYQVGLRFEQSDLIGSSKLAGVSDFGYKYPSKAGDVWKSLFPSLFLSKKLDDKTEVGFNLSRKIQRPDFRQLMPGVQGADRQNIQLGNPALQPEFLDKAEFNYSKSFSENTWLATLYGEYEENTIKPFTSPSTTDPSVLITTFVNGNNETSYGLENTLRLAFSKNVELTTNLNVFHATVTVQNFVNSAWVAGGKANLQVKLPANFSFQINGGYQGKKVLAQGYRKGIAAADFAIKKSFMHNMANVTFSVNDIFNSRKDIVVFDQPQLFQEVMRRREVRFYKFALQIPFGKPDASLFKKRPGREQQQDMDFSN
jgi:hypothetical protein